MHGHDRGRARRDRVGDRSGIDQQVLGFHVNRHDSRTRAGDGQPCRDERVRGDDHLVPRSDAARYEGDGQRVEAVADADTVGGATEGCEIGLEGLHLGPSDVPAGGHDPGVGRVELRPELGVAGAGIQKGDRHDPARSCQERLVVADVVVLVVRSEASTRHTDPPEKLSISRQVIGGRLKPMLARLRWKVCRARPVSV